MHDNYLQMSSPFFYFFILIRTSAYSLSRADQLLLNKLLLKDDAKLRRACAQPSKSSKKIRRKQREKKKGKRRWREGQPRVFKENHVSLKSVPPYRARVSAGPNWRGSRGRWASRFASKLGTGVHYHSRWWSWLQLPPKNTCLFLWTAIGIPISVLFAGLSYFSRLLCQLVFAFRRNKNVLTISQRDGES